MIEIKLTIPDSPMFQFVDGQYYCIVAGRCYENQGNVIKIENFHDETLTIRGEGYEGVIGYVPDSKKYTCVLLAKNGKQHDKDNKPGIKSKISGIQVLSNQSRKWLYRLKTTFRRERQQETSVKTKKENLKLNLVIILFFIVTGLIMLEFSYMHTDRNVESKNNYSEVNGDTTTKHNTPDTVDSIERMEWEIDKNKNRKADEAEQKKQATEKVVKAAVNKYKSYWTSLHSVTVTHQKVRDAKVLLDLSKVGVPDSLESQVLDGIVSDDGLNVRNMSSRDQIIMKIELLEKFFKGVENKTLNLDLINIEILKKNNSLFTKDQISAYSGIAGQYSKDPNKNKFHNYQSLTNITTVSLQDVYKKIIGD